mgnify:CR=1 FL=1
MNAVNILEKFQLFTDHWSPRIVGELNGQLVKLAKFSGEFVWHHHVSEDEMFLVVKGTLTIEFRNSVVVVRENEFIVVPRGVEHRPVAHEEVWVMLFEPACTINTGSAGGEYTKTKLERI